MKVKYRGFEIDVRREKILAGYDMVYRDVFRIKDGWQFWGDFSDDKDTIREHIKSMKIKIDDYFENPTDYERSHYEV